MFYRRKDGNKIQCTACARNCEIIDSHVGYCGVRSCNVKDLKILNYGKFTIVKKHKKDLLVGGIGSNMRYSFDMDWDMSILPYLLAKSTRREEVNSFISKIGYEYTPQELVEYAQSKGCNRVVFQYNEPIVYIEYVLEVAKIFNVKLVSNGYFSKEVLEGILSNISDIDIYLYSIFDKFYFKHSKAQLSIIRENIYKLYSNNKNLRIICPLIPQENDDQKNIENIVMFIRYFSPSIPLVLKKYYPSYRMVDKEVTKDEKMQECEKIALKNGLQDVILE